MNKPLKSIKFPDLEDTYTIPKEASDIGAVASPSSPSTGDVLVYDGSEWTAENLVDNTLATAGKAADAKVVGDALATKTDTDGVYKDLYAGNLLSDDMATDTEPYLFRPSASGKSDREYDEIVGGTVNWNQLVANSGSVSVTVPSGHKYYSYIGGTRTIASSDGTAISATGGADIITDLTALFGSATIADYIYTLEQSTAGAGVSWFKKYFPDDYHAYDAGSLKSVEGLTSHDMVGFNQWDEEWVAGYLSSDGTITSVAGYLCAKNLVPILPSTTYYIKLPNGAQRFICYYDANGNHIERVNGVSNGTFITPPNARYMRFDTSSSYGTTYNHDICINLSDPLRNGEYEPYEEHVYQLDNSVTLRGIPKLDANNKLYYDGDIYSADGTVTRRYGVVDLGTLEYEFRQAGTNTKLFYANVDNAKPSSGETIANIICPNFSRRYIDSLWSDDYAGIGISGGAKIAVRLAAANADTAKTDLNGVYAVYELETPTIESADPYTSPQIVDPYGTEEYVSTGIVPVGHITKYPENLRAKIEGLPWDLSMIAPIENGATASQAYSAGQYFLKDDKFCKALTSIASGATFTFNTNYSVTTVAAELYAALNA